MENEAIRVFGMVLDESENITNEIKMQVYKLLDLEGKTILPNQIENYRLLERIREELETFVFNLQEKKFFSEVQLVIKDELKKLETTGNYTLAENSIMEKLKGLKKINFLLEDDFRDLSKKIASEFHSQDEYYRYFMSRKEKIENMISSYNYGFINALIQLTPKLMTELKDGKDKQTEQTPQKQINQNQSSIELNNMINDIDSKLDIRSKVDGLINACKQKYNELQRRFSYLSSGAMATVCSSKILLEKGEIRKALKQLDKLIHKLYESTYANDLINRYSDIQDINLFHQKVISEIAPSSISAVNMSSTVDNIIGKYITSDFRQYKMNEMNVDEIHQKIVNTSSLSELLNIKQQIENAIGYQYYDTNIRLETQLSIVIYKIVSLTMRNSKNIDPNPTPSLNAYIGESKDDVRTLVNSDNFYSVLHGISSYNVDKYKDFIMLGFNIIMSRWQQQAKLCTTFIEREKSYQDFVELYENFKDYLPLDVGSMLKADLEKMEKYIEQARTKYTELRAARLNSEKKQLNSQVMSSSRIKR